MQIISFVMGGRPKPVKTDNSLIQADLRISDYHIKNITVNELAMVAKCIEHTLLIIVFSCWGVTSMPTVPAIEMTVFEGPWLCWKILATTLREHHLIHQYKKRNVATAVQFTKTHLPWIVTPVKTNITYVVIILNFILKQ